jgi:photosystem II stability/assembly factor-like uncharacterized protein
LYRPTAAQSELLLVGTRKGLFFYERDSAAPSGWRVARRAHVGNPVTYAMRDPRDGTLWASLDHGHWGQKLHRSRDGGETWEEVPAPRYPETATIKERSAAFAEAQGGPPAPRLPATTLLMWVIATGGADQPGRLYIGTEPGGLFQSDDGGDTWRLVESLWNHPTREAWFGGGRDNAAIHSVVVDPRDSRHVFVGVSCGGVYETRDDCATWTPRNKGLRADFLPDPASEVGQDPHLLAACASSPDHLWQQNHCGIFRTTDGAATWTECRDEAGPAGFGFAVAVDPADPDTAWVVPATSDETRVAVSGGVCVSRTTDGGRSWTALRSGLPQEDAYDLTFRHALDLNADTLAFGTTTGNLFVSSNRGDDWSCLNHHLPPVYSVRFAPPTSG